MLIDIKKLKKALNKRRQGALYQYIDEKEDAILYYGLLGEYKGYKISQLVVLDDGRDLLVQLLNRQIPPKLKKIIETHLDIFEKYRNKY